MQAKAADVSQASSSIVFGGDVRLQNAKTISILLKPKSFKEFEGRTGYPVVTNKDKETVALVMSTESSPDCCSPCCSDNYENDPFYYILSNMSGKEIMSVTGLDFSTNTDNKAEITEGPLRNELGYVYYSSLGAAGESMTTTIMIERFSVIVPVSVYDAEGEMLYIFRRDQDSLGYTEILYADGSGIIVAEISIVYKVGGQMVSTTRDRCKIKHGTPEAFKIKFLEDVAEMDKMLLVGVALTLFNQWLTRDKYNKRCCSSCVIL